MTPESSLLWIVLLPLIGATVNGLIALVAAANDRPVPRTLSAVIACAGPTIAFLLAVGVFRQLQGMDEESRVLVNEVYRWIEAGRLQINFTLLADPLSSVMLLVVTGIGGLIHYYSIGYMREDQSHTRYFSYLNLFLFFMLVLVLGDSLITLFVGWEGVGLCSYLLIGFWFQDSEKAVAGMKAFVVNRIGDFGFLLGMLLVVATLSQSGLPTLEIREIAHRIGEFPPGVIEAVGLLLFVGAIGKSAQIPLYIWLPDAMAGPTPVSALIHAATMVTAGVYMIARMGFLYELAPLASGAVLLVGAATAFFAATIGVAQHDIKKVLAYSTVSQLGYMMIGVGIGAYAAGIFHLFTHAFFKACLFLGAGSVIHALHHEQDIRNMGGLLKKMPLTGWTFLVSTAAIAGFPPLSGFFSKDEILWLTFNGTNEALPWAPKLAWGLGTAAALLTAFYMFRLFFTVFTGNPRAKAEHAHESPPFFTVPLIILAAGAALTGLLGIPAVLGGSNKFEHWLAPVFAGAHGAGHGAEHGSAHSAGLEMGLMALAVAIAVAGTLLAYFFYVKRRDIPENFAIKHPALYALVRDKYYVDEIFYAVIIFPLVLFSRKVLWRIVDMKIVDGMVNLVGYLSRGTSYVVRFAETGQVQTYGVMVLAAVAVILWKVL